MGGRSALRNEHEGRVARLLFREGVARLRQKLTQVHQKTVKRRNHLHQCDARRFFGSFYSSWQRYTFTRLLRERLKRGDALRERLKRGGSVHIACTPNALEALGLGAPGSEAPLEAPGVAEDLNALDALRGGAERFAVGEHPWT